MKREKRVRDIMRFENYHVVSEATRLPEVIQHFNGHQSNNGTLNMNWPVLVSNARGKLAGLITPLNILQALAPRFLKREERGLLGYLPYALSKPVFWAGLFSQGAQTLVERTAGEVMQPLIAVKAEDALIKVAHFMMEHKLSALPVMEYDKLTGTVEIEDLFDEVHALLIEKESKKEFPELPKIGELLTA